MTADTTPTKTPTKTYISPLKSLSPFSKYTKSPVPKTTKEKLKPGDLYSVTVETPKDLPSTGAVYFTITVTSQLRGVEWVVERRFSDFDSLRGDLFFRFGVHNKFPAKAPDPGYDTLLLAERAEALQAWSQELLENDRSLKSAAVLAFFGLDAPKKSVAADLSKAQKYVVKLQALTRGHLYRKHKARNTLGRRALRMLMYLLVLGGAAAGAYVAYDAFTVEPAAPPPKTFLSEASKIAAMPLKMVPSALTSTSDLVSKTVSLSVGATGAAVSTGLNTTFSALNTMGSFISDKTSPVSKHVTKGKVSKVALGAGGLLVATKVSPAVLKVIGSARAPAVAAKSGPSLGGAFTTLAKDPKTYATSAGAFLLKRISMAPKAAPVVKSGLFSWISLPSLSLPSLSLPSVPSFGLQGSSGKAVAVGVASALFFAAV